MAGNLLESAAILIPDIPMDYPISIFEKLEEPDSAAYNLMIRGFTLNKSPNEAILLFNEMCERSVRPDEFTFPCILKACARLHALKEGEQIHALVMKYGLGSNGFVLNALIGLYAGCGEVDVARHMFDGMNERSVSAWSWIVAGLNDIEVGEWIHEYVEANGLKGNPTLVTSLVDMYTKCGRVDTARRLFDEMPRRDVVTWNAMISGYSQASRHKEALELFHEMQKADVEPDAGTMVPILSSCAVLGALETGKWVHSYVIKKRMQLTVTLGTALMDSYLKCGSVANAIEVFRKMPSKDVFSWAVLIQGLSYNGQGRKAIEFFNLMVEENIAPNNVTFVAVLCACRHAGLVDEGIGFFVSMSRDFGVEPMIEHYGCMVDILGRAGFIEEAYQFINIMPIQPNAIIWRTLLASCRVHKTVEIGEESLKNVVRLEPIDSGDYILLSNIYASVGRLEDALRVRNQLKEKVIKQMPDCSVIEMDGVIHEFFS
ncbi:hypothetical protein RHMOL_Rhmol08G0245500 [Rhododendron molle]|uniref:Uncharacterized protein n=1 Tax=Rhododendron molle TaxID=49168 RepID=A0ACC0MS29_RHOML|nr:hypothetical protein RHMOL_Rhmol08G0245500 [Rhododendron molle]